MMAGCAISKRIIIPNRTVEVITGDTTYFVPTHHSANSERKEGVDKIETHKLMGQDIFWQH